ncbi:unnamed protein product [Malus baccata var. baccata]
MLLGEAQKELYLGCKQYTVLTYVVELIHTKVNNHMTNNEIDKMLVMMKKMCPQPNNVPNSFRECKKMLKSLGLGCENIHACYYDCALFYKEHKKRDRCPVCNEPRHMSEDMRWHKEKRINDGNTMRHPVDSSAWKEFDQMYPNFARDPRNVRLGLASDRFTPYSDISTPYSMWPVVVFPYNLPPWKCMKKPFSFLTLLIPGPKALGNEIDVYLRPLVDELKELWENGVPTHNKMTGSTFNLRATVMWTINDFSAYGNLSSWSTHGKLACPVCNENGSYTKLRDKYCHIEHRRFLPMNHSWRKNSQLFNGRQEMRHRPKEFSGDDILDQLDSLVPRTLGKHCTNKDKKMKRNAEELNWTRKKDIVLILCKLEKNFPPAFFVLMVHLAMHLPREAKLAGPVGYQWIYHVERLLGLYKKSVRNKARPKGSIMEAHLAYESSTFCSMYLCEVEIKFSRPKRNDDGSNPNALISVFDQKARPFGAHVMVQLSREEIEVAYWYILDNCDEIEDFIKYMIHIEILEKDSHANVQQRHRHLFPKWFRQRIFSLAQGLDQRIVQYTGCIVNDIQYLITHVDQNRTTQNNGVIMLGSHNGETCNFYDILVNYDGDPYVLAKQAHQVFYIDDLKLGHPWKVVQKIQHRHIWDVPEKDDDENEEDNATNEDDGEYVDETENSTRQVHNDDEVYISLCRDDVDPESFDINNEEIRRMLGLQRDEDKEEEDDEEENVGTNDTNDDYN